MIEHKLVKEVARALGPAAMLRVFTTDNQRWQCGGRICCHSDCRPTTLTFILTASTFYKVVRVQSAVSQEVSCSRDGEFRSWSLKNISRWTSAIVIPGSTSECEFSLSIALST